MQMSCVWSVLGTLRMINIHTEREYEEEKISEYVCSIPDIFGRVPLIL